MQESERLSDLPNMPRLESGVEPGPELPRILWPAGSDTPGAILNVCCWRKMDQASEYKHLE